MSDRHISVPRFNVHTAEFEDIPGVAVGVQRLLFESPDGARKAGSFKEPGHYDAVMPCDEVLYVVGGTTTVTVEGGESFVLTAGDCCYLRKGQVLSFDNSEDFHDLSVFMAYDDPSVG
jgi:uncharacterized cupin superfamily protein